MSQTVAVVVLVLSLLSCRSSEPRAQSTCDRERAEREGTLAVENGDLQAAYDAALPCAEEGLAEYEFTVGLLIDADVEGEVFGLSETERDAAALQWLLKAAAQDHEEAARMLAVAYEHGHFGLSPSASLARCWEEMAEGREKPQLCLQGDADEGGQR